MGINRVKRSSTGKPSESHRSDGKIRNPSIRDLKYSEGKTVSLEKILSALKEMKHLISQVYSDKGGAWLASALGRTIKGEKMGELSDDDKEAIKQLVDAMIENLKEEYNRETEPFAQYSMRLQLEFYEKFIKHEEMFLKGFQAILEELSKEE